MMQPPAAVGGRPGEAEALAVGLGALAHVVGDAGVHVTAGRHAAATDIVTGVLTEDGTELGAAGRALLLVVRAASRLQVGWRVTSSSRTRDRSQIDPRRMVDVLDGLDDVTEAEVLLSGVEETAAGLVHAALARVYATLRLYELALPHAERAAAVQDAPKAGPLLEVAALHLEWADDLERSGRTGECRAHVTAARSWWQRVADQTDETSWGPLLELLGADIHARLDPKAGLAPLLRLSRTETGLRAAVLPALARAQRGLGRPAEAVVAAQQALRIDASDEDSRRAARYQLYAAACDQDLPGATGVSKLVELCTADLWDQRRNALEGVRARRELAVVQAQGAETHRLALLDPLTEVGNRRALTSWFAAHPEGPAVVVMVDVDGFKSINDRFGHAVGDLVLRRVAGVLRRRVAELGSDTLLARYGGDEFVLLTAAPLVVDGGLPTLLQRATADLAIADLGADLDIRLTVGSAVAPRGSATDTLLDQADQALLAAKRIRPAGASWTGRRSRR